MGTEAAEVAARLAALEPALRTLIREEAGVLLLRFDSPEDLLQGVHHEAMRSVASLEWRGDEALRAWVYQIARRHLSARRDYWFARKRNAGALLRLTLSGGSGESGPRGVQVADTATGPATFAFRREQLLLVSRAVEMLLPRDRNLVTWSAEGVPIGEQAQRLGISRDAAERARSRAMERLRKTFEIASRGRAAGNAD